MAGWFITFEGGEGAGKSTQIRRLADRLRSAGLDVVVTREPGGSPRAERIRDHLLSGGAREHGALAEALLFSSARADHLDAVIRPALARGAAVLCDRFLDSTTAYQGAVGEVPAEVIAALHRIAVGSTRPDLTLILDVGPEVGLARAGRRRAVRSEVADRFEAEGPAFHARLREAFRAIAAAEPDRCVLVDGARDADAVEADIWRAVAGRLGLPARAEPGAALV